MRPKPLRSLLLLASALFALGPADALSLPPYTVSHSPENPQKGELLVVEIRLEGEAEASIGAVRLGKGLSLEASSSRPFVDAEAGKRGSLLRLELRVLGTGDLRVESVEIRLSGGSASLGPLAFAGSGEGKGGQSGRHDWRWVAPAAVYRYEAFGIRLEGGPSKDAVADFEAPAGAAFEPAEEPLSWTATALLPGRLVLPEARLRSRKGPGSAEEKAPPLEIEVRELPPALDATRAIGDFSLRFERSGSGPAQAGERLRFRLILSGLGNHLSLLFPELDASLQARGRPAEPLPPGLLRKARSDALSPSSSGYEGSSVLELSLEAPGPGLLRLAPRPFPFLGPGGSLSLLRVEPIEVEILPRAAAAVSPDPFEGVGTKEGRLSDAARLWHRGEKGGALAELYGLCRERPYEARLASIAAACELSTGAGPRLRDSLPPPRFFLLGLLPALLLAAGLFLAYRRGSGRRRQGLLVGASLAAALAILLLGFSLTAASERGARYAVAWSEEAFVVPSARVGLGGARARGRGPPQPCEGRDRPSHRPFARLCRPALPRRKLRLGPRRIRLFLLKHFMALVVPNRYMC
jgi:hypothetical protein